MEQTRPSETAQDTASHILDVAERLAQTQGYNGFSYADIAAEVGITKASLHYHFRTKAELGRRLIERYSVSFRGALADIEASPSAALDKLAAYAKLYSQVLNAERLCLCGMLAAEYSSLPGPMQEEVRRFFDINEDWLSRILGDGRETGALRFEGDPRDMARLLLGSLEGAMLVARPYADSGRFEAAVQRLLMELAPA